MSGRWPANVILSPEMAEVLDQQSGTTKSAPRKATGNPIFKSGPSFMGGGKQIDKGDRGHIDEGGASRFFLNAGYEPWELEWIYSVGLRPCGSEEQ